MSRSRAKHQHLAEKICTIGKTGKLHVFFIAKILIKVKKSSLSLVTIFVVLKAYRYRSLLKREDDRLDLQGRHKHLLCSRCTVFPQMPQLLI